MRDFNLWRLIAFFIALSMTCLGTAVWAEDSTGRSSESNQANTSFNSIQARGYDFYESNIYSLNPNITPEKVDLWKNAVLELFNKYGISLARFDNLNLTEFLGLLYVGRKYSDGEPDFQRLESVIQYWIQEFKLDNLNRYIQETKYIRQAYHLFKVNLISWIEFNHFLNEGGFFDKLGADPVNSYLMLHLWGEGVATSGKSDPDHWRKWILIFKKYPDLKTKMNQRFSLLKLKEDHDLVQSLYIAFSSDILKLVLDYSEFMSADFLVEVASSKSQAVYSHYSSDLIKILKILKRLTFKSTGSLEEKNDITVEKIKIILPELINDYLLNLKDFSSSENDLNKKIDSLYKLKINQTIKQCGEYLRL